MKLISRIKIFVIISVTVFVLFELALRFHDPWGLNYFGDAIDYFDAMVVNAQYSYLHKKNSEDVFGKVRVKINSDGMRWYQLHKMKQRRLLILGDSVVFGWGVSQENIFPNLLQERLSNIEIVPAGVGSWNTKDQCSWLMGNSSKLEIDSILLVVTANDMFFKKKLNQKATYIKLFIKHSKIGSLLYWFHKMASNRFPSDAEESMMRVAVFNIYSYCHVERIELKVLLYGTKEMVALNHVLNKYSNQFSRLGVAQYFLPNNLLKRENQLSDIDRHLNHRGHRMLTNHLYREVLERQ